MKSFYAVVGQMILSGSNYLVFLIFTTLLSENDFIGFSTAVALNILAYAVAEGGISFVAPIEISKKNNTKAILSGGFVSISILLYLLSLILGFNSWFFFTDESLNLNWVVSYALYFFPVLIIPSWLTCWSIDLPKVIILSVSRGLTVIAIYFFPTALGLFLSGLLFMFFIIFFIIWLNKDETILRMPSIKSFFIAKNKVAEVFLSKTSSYVVYSLVPLIVASIYGNKISSLYIIGERLKSMYSTFFQPLIQTVYLTISKNKNKNKNKGINLPYYIAVFNVILTLILVFLILNDKLSFLGERFSLVPNLHIYIIASCLSILTACMLYFKVLPEGNYKLFRRATYFQMVIFILLFFLMNFNKFLKPEIVLLLGELSIFLVIVFQLLNKKSK